MKKILILVLTLLSFSCVGYAAGQRTDKPSALVSAVYHDDIIGAEQLLNMGYDPNEKYVSLPVVFYAVGYDKPEMLHLLLSKGANPNTVYKGDTVLGFAIYKNKIDCIKTLIHNNADVNQTSNFEKPLNQAIKQGQPYIAEILINAGAIPDEKTDKLLKRPWNKKYAQLLPEPDNL